MDKRLVAVMAMLAVVLYAGSAAKQSRCVNVDMHKTDQSAYMGYARKLAESNFQHVGDRARMPLYPAVMALFYDTDMSDEAFFKLGKNVGIAIGLLVVITAFLLFTCRANTVDAGVATLVVMFTVIAFKAPAFQAEVLYYGLFLIVFVLMLRVLRIPHLGLSALAGVVAALAHLTKGAAPPAVLLFLFCMAGQAGLAVVCPARKQVTESTSKKRDWIRARKYTLCAMVFVFAFLTVVWPYIRTSKVRFGRYSYNVNSTFYIWYDSWEEAKNGTRARGDRVGWPDMPSEELPSLAKYLREHTPGQIAGRFWRGLRVMRVTATASYGYVPFVGLYVGFVGLLLVQNRRKLLGSFRDGHNVMIMLFITVFFTGYLLLYAWCVPIDAGNRHFLVLVLPALYLMVGILSRAGEQEISVRLLGRSIPTSAFSPMAFIILLCYVAFKFGYCVQRMPGYT